MSVAGDYRISIDSAGPTGPPWQNPRDRFDINDDMFVTVSDLRVLLTDISTNGFRLLTQPPPAGELFFYVDVSGDDQLSLTDLRQWLEFFVTPTGGGEGESSGDAGWPKPLDEPSVWST